MMLHGFSNRPDKMIKGTSLTGLNLLIENQNHMIYLLNRSKILHNAIGQYSYDISYECFNNFLQKTADDLQLPSFGLKLADIQKSTALGPMRHLALSATTVANAMQALLQNYHFYTNASVFDFHIDKNKDLVKITFGTLTDSNITAQTTEKALLHVKLLIDELTGSKCTPVTVGFSHKKQSDLWQYQLFFNAPVSFLRKENYISFKREDFQLVTITRDPVLHELIKLGFASKPKDKKEPHISEIMRPFLSQKRCTIQIVAQTVGVSVRTLQRMLDREGISFEMCLDSLRKEIASELMFETKMSINDIAFEIGYRHPTSFCRAYKRWFGLSPNQHRKKNQTDMLF